MQSTITALRSRVRSLGAPASDGKNIVAFSGGVDSSLVAALVHHVFPGSSQACVGVSSALPTAQLDLARSVASHIGEGRCVCVRCGWDGACPYLITLRGDIQVRGSRAGTLPCSLVRTYACTVHAAMVESDLLYVAYWSTSFDESSYGDPCVRSSLLLCARAVSCRTGNVRPQLCAPAI